MAILDQARNVIVLRIVYDGPPEAGKTTSLRVLSKSLGRSLYSPEEQDGRTLYFDWMDYTGGRFEGYEIRCQIVSVPGQEELASRRRRLLETADVVVFVADSTRARLQETQRRLQELPVLLGADGGPRVGVLVQANKRDRPDAVPLGELREHLGDAGAGIGIVESVASDGEGIREAFVFAVRLALDRVREMLRTSSLRSGEPDVDDGVSLLSQMRADEGDAITVLRRRAEAPLLDQVFSENHDERRVLDAVPWRARDAVSAGEGDAPWPPDATAPSGSIWPPVEGRLILHEATSARMPLHRLRNGAWAAGLGDGWRAYSSGGAVYADLEVGRAMLIRLARMHSACARRLSTRRCVVLSPAAPGRWRLWQIVRAERSLREELEDLGGCSAEEAASRIIDAATLLCEMSQRLRELACEVPCSIDTVGRGDAGAVYIGLMPMELGDAASPAATPPHLGAELAVLFRSTLHERRSEILAAIARRPRPREGASEGADELIQRLVAAS